MHLYALMKGRWIMAFIRGGIALVFLATALPSRAEECTFLQNGIASIYAEKFNGRQTASGETFDMNGHTAAHPSLPFGTRLKVTDRRTGKSTYVRINDRGPHVKNRALDVSRAVRTELGWGRTGVYRVRLSVCK